jgi:hypothetical protein
VGGNRVFAKSKKVRSNKMLTRKFSAGLPGRLLALGVAMAAASGSAHAEYAVSTTTITNFDINGISTLSDFTFSTDVAATDPGLSEAFGGTQDAASACVGTACASYTNSFTAHGASGDYAYGDANIVSDDVLNANGWASSIGEVSVVSPVLSFASGKNTLTGSFTLASAGSLSFSFNANPYQQVTGSLATATSAMSVTLLQKVGLNSYVEVFSWTPNGDVGTGIVGGSETSDQFNLNLGVAPGVTYNPGTGLYQASTNSLVAGTYKININMENEAIAQAVPEADTWAMMAAGLGLVALGVRRRRFGLR